MSIDVDLKILTDVKKAITMANDPVPAVTAQYENAVVRPQHQAEIASICTVIRENQDKYDAVSAATGMPWYLIAAIHNLESGLDFTTYLQNGDPLFDADGNGIKTTHVPAGVGPFQDWQSAAIAALGGPGAGSGMQWSLGYCLRWAEAYNGLGYRHMGIPSPYEWSYTDQYTKGKYVEDGVFDPNAVSDQAGVAAVFKGLSL